MLCGMNKERETAMRLSMAGPLFIAFMVAALVSSAQTAFDSMELQARRKAAIERIPDGIILLRSYSGLKHWEESGFHQDSSFYYFTGLANAHGAILALDGQQKEAWLFVPPRQSALGADLHGFDSIFVDPGAQTEGALKIEHVVLWDQLMPFIESRRKSNAKLVLYTDSAGQTGSMYGEASIPPGLEPLENFHWAWATMLQRHWPDVAIKDGFAVLDEVRSVKSAVELARLRKAAAVTADGFC